MTGMRDWSVWPKPKQQGDLFVIKRAIQKVFLQCSCTELVDVNTNKVTYITENDVDAGL